MLDGWGLCGKPAEEGLGGVGREELSHLLMPVVVVGRPWFECFRNRSARLFCGMFRAIIGPGPLQYRPFFAPYLDGHKSLWEHKIDRCSAKRFLARIITAT